MLAVSVLMFLFRHRLTRSRLIRSKKPVHQHNKIHNPAISEQAPIASDPASIAPKYSNPELHSYHSVEIVNESNMCASAKKLKGKRYLSQNAPTIPLLDCESKDCSCRYVHYDDRRKYNEDRRLEFGVTQELFGVFGETNRRGTNPKGRRTSDQK